MVEAHVHLTCLHKIWMEGSEVGELCNIKAWKLPGLERDVNSLIDKTFIILD